MQPFPPEVLRAYELARQTRDNSHSPYSRFKVGSALKMKSGPRFYAGTNVENASYGGTICAERSAMVSAIAAEGRQAWEFIVVVTDTEPASLPCAFCLGVMAEFCPPDFPIYLANLQGLQNRTTLGELLPKPFVFVPPAP